MFTERLREYDPLVKEKGHSCLIDILCKNVDPVFQKLEIFSFFSFFFLKLQDLNVGD
jgi:hypothetical protein